MKQYSLYLIPLVLLLTGCGVTSSQSGSDNKASKKEKRVVEFENTALLVESGNYIYKVQSANTGGGKTIQVSPPYSMKASKGNYEATLPYFGQVYQANIGGSGGIEFNGIPQDLKISKNTDKLSITVSFAITNSGEKYNANLVIGSNGYGTMTIYSQRRQAISYYGRISEVEASEK